MMDGVISVRNFAYLIIIYGVVQVLGNLFFNGGLGNAIGFSLFVFYGIFLIYRGFDTSSWGYFKHVNRFMMIFGVTYVVRGIIGGGDINAESSIILGVLIILVGVYMDIKVYRIADESHLFRGSIIYAVLWIILVIFLILSIIGTVLELPDLFNNIDGAKAFTEMISAALIVAVMVFVLSIVTKYCRPGQMSDEVYVNPEYKEKAKQQNQLLGPQGTFSGAMIEAHKERSRLETSKIRTQAIVKAFNSAGCSVDYKTEQMIFNAVDSYYPTMTYSDAKSVVDRVIRNSNMRNEPGLSSRVQNNLNYTIWSR